MTKHIYYPAGASVTAEKPLIYDKVESLGAGAGAGRGYQTTQLSTFRPGPGAECGSSAESSCSALCPGPGDTLGRAPHQGHGIQPGAVQGGLLGPGTKRRVLNTYSSLPRPGHTSHAPLGWSYADQAEVLSRARQQQGPEYANLVPWWEHVYR